MIFLPSTPLLFKIGLEADVKNAVEMKYITAPNLDNKDHQFQVIKFHNSLLLFNIQKPDESISCQVVRS